MKKRNDEIEKIPAAIKVSRHSVSSAEVTLSWLDLNISCMTPLFAPVSHAPMGLVRQVIVKR